jgi:hypothetical protein
MLPSLVASGRLFPLQTVLHERRLICRKTLAPSAEVKKRVTVFDEYRPEFLGRIRHCESAGMSGIGIAGSVNEQDRRRWRRTRGSRQKASKAQVPTGDYNDPATG